MYLTFYYLIFVFACVADSLWEYCEWDSAHTAGGG